jgi:hypothetical protein
MPDLQLTRAPFARDGTYTDLTVTGPPPTGPGSWAVREPTSGFPGVLKS